MQHPIQQKTHLVHGFYPSLPANFLLTYSKASLIIYIIAIIRAPKAMEPI